MVCFSSWKSPNSDAISPHERPPCTQPEGMCPEPNGPEAPAQRRGGAVGHVSRLSSCKCGLKSEPALQRPRRRARAPLNASRRYNRLVGATQEVGEGLSPAGLQPSREKSEALLARRRPHKVKQHLKPPPLAGEGRSCY